MTCRGLLLLSVALVASASGSALAQPWSPDMHGARIAWHAAANGVPPSLVRRVIQIESKGNPTLISKGNYGLMQIRLGTAKAMSDEARRRAEEANLAKSRFLATMSHELRTPLNAILGFSEVMKTEVFGPHQVAAYKEYSNDIHNSGQHLLNLINEILDLSRIEAGRYELNEEPVSLTNVVQDCHHLLKLRASSRGGRASMPHSREACAVAQGRPWTPTLVVRICRRKAGPRPCQFLKARQRRQRHRNPITHTANFLNRPVSNVESSDQRKNFVGIKANRGTDADGHRNSRGGGNLYQGGKGFLVAHQLLLNSQGLMARKIKTFRFAGL